MSTDVVEKAIMAGNGPRACRICSERSDGAHFGVDSCRACAAFFRRSVVLGKKYVCRQGGNKCIINKSIRCMCRKCRMTRCLDCGMLPESVHRKKDQLSESQAKSNGFAAEYPVAPSTSSFSPSPSENEIGGQFQRAPGSAFQVVHASSSASSLVNGFSPYKQPRRRLLLDKVLEQYRHMCTVRRATEYTTASESTMRGLFDTITEATTFRPATFNQVTQSYKAHVPILAEFVSASFTDFVDLTQDEKWCLFQNFVTHLWPVEAAYLTATLLPKDEENKMMATQTTYLNMGEPETFFAEGEVKTDVAQVASLLKNHIKQSLNCIVRPMQAMDIADIEFCALISLCFWSPECLGIRETSPKIIELCKKLRSEIFNDLHVYYREDRSIDNYADRLGGLMMLLCTAQRSFHRFKEDLEMFNLFNVFEIDSFIYDIVKST